MGKPAEKKPLKRRVCCRVCGAEQGKLYIAPDGSLWAEGVGGDVRILGYVCGECGKNIRWGERR